MFYCWFYYVRVTWQQLFKGSLQVTVVDALPHITVELLFRDYMTILRPNKKHLKHVTRLRNAHFLSSGTAKDHAITRSNCTICAILSCVKHTNIGTAKKN